MTDDVDGAPRGDAVRQRSGSVAGAVLVARYDLLRRLRSRSALFTAFVGPLALAVVFSLLVGGGGEVRFVIGVADDDDSELSQEVVGGVLDGGTAPEGEVPEGADAETVAFVRLADGDAARAAVDDDEVDAALVVPAGYGDDVAAGLAPPLTVLRDPAAPIAAEVARSVAGSIAGEIGRATLVARVALAEQPSLGVDAAVDAARSAPPPLVAVDVPMGAGEVSVGAYFGASMAVLFLFFTIGLAARSIVAERRGGTLARILSTPTSMASVIAGKVLAVSLLGLAGFVTVWLVTSLGFGAEWGAPTAVLATMLTTIVAVGGVAMFVAAVARTDQQAETYTAAVAFTLAVLGGNFIGPGQAPPLLRQLSLLTPNGWALETFTAIAVDRDGLSDVAPALAALVVFGLVFGGVAVVLLARRGAA